MRKKISVAISVMLAAVSIAGCGEVASIDPGKNIELIEPVNAAVDNLETVHRRNLYVGKTFEINVYPYVEEYAFEDKSYTFSEYHAYPGDTVKKGDVLVSTTTEALDKQIEAMEERLQGLTDALNEYGAEAAEKYAELKEIVTVETWAMGEMEKVQPAETIAVNGEQVANPEYTAWKKKYDALAVKVNKAEFDIEVLHSENDQKVALYNLDYAYYNGQLQELKAEKNNAMICSGMDGQIVAIQPYAPGTRLPIGRSLVAVADMSQKFVKCEAMDERLVMAAYEIFAYIDGKRYEVTYQRSDDKRCSTFVLHDENNEAPMGAYGILVCLEKGARDVLTLSNEAIRQDITKKYVHILQDGEVTTREVTTGISDGMFTEILTGLSEGDRVVVNEVKAPGENRAVLARERVSTEISYKSKMYYPLSWTERYQPKYVDAEFAEYLVPVSTDVKAGDPLARISIEVSDPIGAEKKEMEYLREKQRLADYIEANRDAIETNEAVANKITSWQERVDVLAEEAKVIQEEYTTTILTASKDGRVENLTQYYTPPNLDDIGGYLLTMYDTSIGFAKTEHKGFINYGTELQFQYRKMNDKVNVANVQVVTFGGYGVSEDFDTTQVMVRIPDELVGNIKSYDQGKNSARELDQYLKGEGKVAGNVLTVPAKAVTEKDGMTYVDVLLEDGTVKTVSFISGGNTRAYYWVVEGLEEGMTVCW